MRLVPYCYRHRRALFVAFAGVCLWGIGALFTLPSSIYPPVTFPRIAVIAEKGEESVENMMVGVTRPLEQALAAIPGLMRMRAKTTRGATELSLDFQEGTNMANALGQSRAKVAETISAAGGGIETTVEQQTPSVFPVISFNAMLRNDGLTSSGGRGLHTVADLAEWANLELKPRLARLPDVFMVNVQGAATREVIVEVDPAALGSRGIALDDVVAALKAANVAGAAGRVQRDYRQWQVLVSGQFESVEDVARVPVSFGDATHPKSVELGQLARVRLGEADRTKVITGDGSDAVVISLFLRDGGKVTELSRSLKEALETMKPDFPAGISIGMVYDQANLVNDSLAGVRDAILLGSILAGIVLLFFLSSWRVALLAALSIPMTVAATLALMQALGLTLDLMSLGGLAVSIGLVIDDAIVVVENMARKTASGGTVSDATAEVFGAVVGSSFTSVAVFAPLVLLHGVVGQFFRSLALTLATAILVSMVVSLALIPVMGLTAVRPRKGEKLARAWTTRLAALYGTLLGQILRFAWPAAIALALIAIIGFASVRKLPTGFLPEMDEGGFVLDYSMPVGTSLSETDKNCRFIENELKATPEVSSFSRRTGAELGFFATEQFTGDFLVGLKPRSQRKRSSSEVMDDLRQRLESRRPQVEVEFVQVLQDTINDLAGNPSPLEIKFFGTDYRKLQAAADQAAAKLEHTPGIVDVKSGVSFGSPEAIWHVDPLKARTQGLSAEDIEKAVSTALLGEVATTLRLGERLLPVRVRYPDSLRFSSSFIAALPLESKNGGSVTLDSVAKLQEKINPNELAREDQQPMVAVTAGVAPDSDLGTAAASARKVVAPLSSPGVRIEVGGQVASQRTAFKNLTLVLTLSLGIVFLLLVAQFRSIRLPFVIFLALPFGLFGALGALRVTGEQLNISSFMGLVMLVGLVVKNGIIMIEYAEQLMEGGLSLLQAAITAAQTRMRPILMTSLASILGLLPLALNIGAGAELQRPLAIAVIGGLLVSTVFTLVAVPLGLVLFGTPSKNGDKSLSESGSGGINSEIPQCSEMGQAS